MRGVKEGGLGTRGFRVPRYVDIGQERFVVRRDRLAVLDEAREICLNRVLGHPPRDAQRPAPGDASRQGRHEHRIPALRLRTKCNLESHEGNDTWKCRAFQVTDGAEPRLRTTSCPAAALNPARTSGLRCAVYYYLGAKVIVDGRISDARASFEQTLATNEFEQPAFDLAKLHLGVLQEP